MLTITVPSRESFDESTNKFIKTDETVLELEHSLVSLSKWESEHEKPFLSDKPKSDIETLSYVKAMTLTPNVPPEVYMSLSRENIDQINTYISAKRSATWFSEKKARPGPSAIVTAELIYYWMIALTIPFECQSWHLNRLMTLIKVCNEKNAASDTKKNKPMTKDSLAQRKALNEQRKKQLQSRG